MQPHVANAAPPHSHALPPPHRAGQNLRCATGRHATGRSTPGGLASASPCAWTGLHTDHKASAVRPSPSLTRRGRCRPLRWPTMPPSSRAALLLWRVRALPCVQRGRRLEPPPREVAEDDRGSVPEVQSIYTSRRHNNSVTRSGLIMAKQSSAVRSIYTSHCHNNSVTEVVSIMAKQTSALQSIYTSHSSVTRSGLIMAKQSSAVQSIYTSRHHNSSVTRNGLSMAKQSNAVQSIYTSCRYNQITVARFWCPEHRTVVLSYDGLLTSSKRELFARSHGL
ncbi:uncharacterized protein [Triticum aestivum]|uniref:uncharacterized protein n=1 Tax=Triticum aestivum TaxID=4565 RepID=UPI001D0223D5|nr:uncharacterized protein LOC123069445 [Triticum aestivum]